MINIERAIQELESCLASQWKNGMLPHIRFVKDEVGYSPNAQEWDAKDKTVTDEFQTSGITQPPVLAIALEKIINFENYQNQFDDNIVTLVEGIDKFHTFLFEYRDPYDENLVTIIHPWESGLDNLPIFDQANANAKDTLNALNIEQQIKKREDLNRVIAEFRPGEKDYEVYGKLIGFFKKYDYDQLELAKNSPFRVQDVLYNSLLYKSLNSVVNIYKYLYKQTKNSNYKKLADKSLQKATQVKDAVIKKLYSVEDDNFYSYDLIENKMLKFNTIESLISSLYFLDKNPKDIIESYQDSSFSSFLSTSNREKDFNPIKYWRGPIWPITNWFIIDHLKDTDIELAKEYAASTIDIISEGYEHKETYINAKKLMFFNLVFDNFTTPSKNQYKHGWLWDSGFASIGWLNVDKFYSSEVYGNIYKNKNSLINENIDLYEIQNRLRDEFQVSLFDEYYIGADYQKYKKNEPLGSEMMTWTAAVYLDLYKFYYSQSY
jgi:hypothetical protein